jgi:hypothetical protein
MRRPTGSGYNHLNTSTGGALGILEHAVRRAMSAYNTNFKGDIQQRKDICRFLHNAQVALTSHYNSYHSLYCF